MSEEAPKRKVFVSYKYKDASVFQFSGADVGADTDYRVTPRHYVDSIIEILGADSIYKGEKSDEDASHLADSTIDSKLKEKIFDSSVTAVLLSPNMKDPYKPPRDQWIPNEIHYSLLNKTRGDRRSKTNGMLAIALPDANNSYDYAMIKRSCSVREWQTADFFYILRANMFNRKEKRLTMCKICFSNHHNGADHSYIHPVVWEDFRKDHIGYIEQVVKLRDELDDFEIIKDIGSN